jgi:DNA processing protein
LDGMMATPRSPGRFPYEPPEHVQTIAMSDALRASGRFGPGKVQSALDVFHKGKAERRELTLYYAGDLSLLKRPCVSVVGTRELSEEGVRRARKLAAMLVQAGVVVVSGLALGVDTEAHTAALAAGGFTVAVLGTPLDRCNPPRNAALQRKIYLEHLAISQFERGSEVFPSNFPQRNRVMAALSDATVIVEASDTSGTLHQAAECVRLARPLFILKSVAEDERLSWPAKFLRQPNTHVLDDFGTLAEVLALGV